MIYVSEMTQADGALAIRTDEACADEAERLKPAIWSSDSAEWVCDDDGT